MSGLQASMRLYGLVKTTGSSDDPNRQAVEILCMAQRTGGLAIRAFVSRLDAELMTRSADLGDYRVVALRTFDPTAIIDAHQGWLMLHVSCGFVALAGHSLLKNGALIPMGWHVYSEVGRWTSRHHLDLGVEMVERPEYERPGRCEPCRCLGYLHCRIRWRSVSEGYSDAVSDTALQREEMCVNLY
ncbi:hypothetical protein [Pseudomonas atacamensis]|uniref:hypothetical protein n=1 Tax=Pseudomonas atacamensis TaxID=2565368 RepID=UPI002B1D67E8|nr:hypothetical protein [Pseudomonas atacamensis]